MNKNLRLVLITAFLDLLWFWILLPSLPSITAHFDMAPSWTVWSQAVYSFGMFAAWGIVGSLSDVYGRKNMLLFVNILNVFWYILIGVSYFFVGHIGTMIAFWLFIFSRFVAWMGGSGFGVIQAYVSDISKPEEKTKNMGMIGATFGTAFLIWPAIGGIIWEFWWFASIIWLSIVIMCLNTAYIFFKLPEPSKHVHEKKDTAKLHYSPIILFLFASWLLVTIGFSSIQWGSTQFYKDIFGFSEREIGFAMSMVGLSSIVYQGFLVKYIRQYLTDENMMLFGIAIMGIFTYLFGINRDPILLFAIVLFLPVGMGSFNPSLVSLLGQNAGSHVGKVMGINASIVGIGGIIGPVLVGILYIAHPSIPYISASILFGILFVISLIFFRYARFKHT